MPTALVLMLVVVAVVVMTRACDTGCVVGVTGLDEAALGISTSTADAPSNGEERLLVFVLGGSVGAVEATLDAKLECGFNLLEEGDGPASVRALLTGRANLRCSDGTCILLCTIASRGRLLVWKSLTQNLQLHCALRSLPKTHSHAKCLTNSFEVLNLRLPWKVDPTTAGVESE